MGGCVISSFDQVNCAPTFWLNAIFAIAIEIGIEIGRTISRFADQIAIPIPILIPIAIQNRFLLKNGHGSGDILTALKVKPPTKVRGWIKNRVLKTRLVAADIRKDETCQQTIENDRKSDAASAVSKC